MTIRAYPQSEWLAFTRAFVHESARGFTKRALLAWMKASLDVLKNYTVRPWDDPLLIMTSRDDILSYGKAGALKERYPQADVHVFERGGHHTVFLFPREYADTITGFLDSHIA